MAFQEYKPKQKCRFERKQDNQRFIQECLKYWAIVKKVYTLPDCCHAIQLSLIIFTENRLQAEPATVDKQ